MECLQLIGLCVCPHVPFLGLCEPCPVLGLPRCSWVASAGGVLADEEEGCVEVGPLASYFGEGLEGLCAGRVFEEAYDPLLQVRADKHL